MAAIKTLGRRKTNVFKESVLDVGTSFNGGSWKYVYLVLFLRLFYDLLSSEQDMQPNVERKYENVRLDRQESDHEFLKALCWYSMQWLSRKTKKLRIGYLRTKGLKGCSEYKYTNLRCEDILATYSRKLNKFRSYLTENIFRLHYKDQSVNASQEQKCSLFGEQY
jgi:hypothetical protein